MTFAVVVTFLVRLSLVLLFFPFSAVDKAFGFGGAMKQAEEAFSNPMMARIMVLVGLAVEIVAPLCILSGIADRLAAFVMAGFCAMTALLFKPFWKHGGFWHSTDGKARDQFWDFLKNFAVAGGFLLITFSPTAAGVPAFFQHPLSSTHPYAQVTHD